MVSHVNYELHRIDSLFTNVHDLVSFQPVIDGRGTFTHLGVCMEGLESKRHLNFKAVTKDNQISFCICFNMQTNVFP